VLDTAAAPSSAPAPSPPQSPPSLHPRSWNPLAPQARRSVSKPTWLLVQLSRRPNQKPIRRHPNTNLAPPRTTAASFTSGDQRRGNPCPQTCFGTSRLHGEWREPAKGLLPYLQRADGARRVGALGWHEAGRGARVAAYGLWGSDDDAPRAPGRRMTRGHGTLASSCNIRRQHWWVSRPWPSSPSSGLSVVVLWWICASIWFWARVFVADNELLSYLFQ
jgi:hypothetical protein